jgi:uncharacterized membrane protein YraQ (UPF0718 family)
LDIFTILFLIVAIVLTVISLVKDKRKTVVAMKKSKNIILNMLGQIIAIVFLIGLILTLIPTETIQSILGSANQYLSTFIGALIGSITLIPAFIAFPLAGSLVDAGASILPIVAFLTTLTMVGVVTFPLERKEFGTKFALTRNLLSFVFAIVISLVMGVVL